MIHAESLTRNDTTRYSRRLDGMPRSCVRDLMANTANTDIISFAGGLPASECIPLDTIRQATEAVWTRYGTSALGYGASEGEPALREWIAHQWLPRKGIQAKPSEIMIVNGSQQALDLLGKVLLDPGAPIAVERPTYLAAVQAFSAFGAEFREVPLDDEGPDITALAQALRGNSSLRADGARLFYTVPNFQNPSGLLMSERRRMDLLDEMRRHPAVLIEDDPYGELYYASQPPPLLMSQSAGPGVLLGTFSKMVAPGFRLGFIWAKGAMATHLGTVKQAADLCTSRLAQLQLFETLCRLDLDAHLQGLRDHYRIKRDAMDMALQRHLAGFANWQKPSGGMFFWVRLRNCTDTKALLVQAAKAGVAFADGGSFHAGGGGRDWLRLNFTSSTPADMERGLEILAQCLGKSD